MAKRKSEEVPPVGVVAGAAVGPWLGVGVPHALATIASAASSPIARRVRRLMTQCLLGLLRVLVRPTCLDDGAEAASRTRLRGRDARPGGPCDRLRRDLLGEVARHPV